MVSGGLIRRFSRPKSFRCGLPAPVRATAVISLLGFLAFLLLVTALPSAPAYAGTPIQGPAQTGYLQDMRDAALDEVNVRRDVAQVAPVEVHPALEEAAQQHALYLLLNSDEWGGGFSAHVEDSELPGFYATGLGERVDLAGYPHTYVMEDVLRLTSDTDYGGEPPWAVEKVVGRWIDAPFHRRTVLGESVEEVGFGYATDGHHHVYVLVAGRDFLASSHPSSVQPYPSDGQQNVPLEWDGREHPSPFTDLSYPDDYPSGYPLTVFPVHGEPNYYSARLTLTTADGQDVPVVQSSSPNFAFAPVEPLVPGTTYEATFTYRMRNAYTGIFTQGERTWSFTTEGSSTGSTTTTTTTTTTAPSTTTTVPSTTTTMVAPTTTTTVAGIVPPPTTTTTTTPTTEPPGGGSGGVEFRDITDSPYRSAILSCAADGVISGYAGSPPTFQPWESITRAQVVTMIVRAARQEGREILEEPAADFVPTLPTSDSAHGENLLWAEANGLLEGIALEGWDIWASASRGEVAQMLWNLMEDGA